MKRVVLLIFVVILVGCKDKENQRGYDIYAVGFNKPNAGGVAYWKNFEEITVDDGGDQILVTGMLVDGQDMYYYGQQLLKNQPARATYWKNGTRVQLTNGQVNAMAVSGSDVYAAGFETDKDGQWHAAYWKNGTITQLPHKIWSSATGIAIMGSDVHVIGSEDKPDTVFARYWKNEQSISLIPKALISKFTSITSSGSDVYIAGYQFNDFNTSQIKASYWKNGSNEVVLGNGVTGGIAVSGNDVYVAGDQIDQSIFAGYWKNQSYHSLMGTSAFYRPNATHIAIAPNGDVIVMAAKLEPSGARLGSSILWINDESQPPFKGNNTQYELMGIAIGK